MWCKSNLYTILRHFRSFSDCLSALNDDANDFRVLVAFLIVNKVNWAYIQYISLNHRWKSLKTTHLLSESVWLWAGKCGLRAEQSPLSGPRSSTRSSWRKNLEVCIGMNWKRRSAGEVLLIAVVESTRTNYHTSKNMLMKGLVPFQCASKNPPKLCRIY